MAVRPKRRRMALFVGIGGVVLALAVAAWQTSRTPPGPEDARELFTLARRALRRDEYDRARELASQVPPNDRVFPRACLVAGEAAMKLGEFDAAIEHFQAVPRDGSSDAVLAVFSIGEVQRHLGRLTDAEREFRYVLEHEPDDAAAHERMAFLLGVSGQRWESLQHFENLIRTGSANFEELALAADLERPMEQEEYLKTCIQEAPDDLLVQSGLAAAAVARGESDEARELLGRVIARSPQQVAAHAMLGELLVDADDATFTKWHDRLPAEADRSADIWFVRGLWARRHGRLRVAVRCFWETVRIAPTHRRGMFQLGQVLLATGNQAGNDFAKRAETFVDLTQSLDAVLKSNPRDERAVGRVTVLLEQTGRLWEAWGWAGNAIDEFPQSAWPQQIFARLSGTLDRRTPRTTNSANLALIHDFSSFPDHTGLLESVRQSSSDGSVVDAGSSSIRFEEATDAGIDFVYNNGADPSTKGARIFEQNGGGVAVLDFDLDRWPDLYFTQGANWIHGEQQPQTSPDVVDGLYRNINGTSFSNVTGQAHPGNPEFGQGVTVGDFDNDGFPDLYVANIGRNRLYHNNGDGTFTDVTERAGLQQHDWTTSCVIVDLNADGFADLFDVNYVTGPDVYEVICDGHACSPKGFEGIPDRLHLSSGDGSFDFVDGATPDADSKGMGVIAMDLQTRGRPSLFIANDQVPNFFLRNSAVKGAAGLRCEDQAFACGLAFNVDGMPLACMGVAADDVDGDGRVDLFVTNFRDEPNTLYLQDAAGLFIDNTNAAGLRGASLPFVGWGTQFLDADRDGHVDLVVANGDVDDYRDEGGDYHMRPQCFHNNGTGRFVELFADTAGEFFDRTWLGRGLARLDWNRDGRMDFVVSNIGARASLVNNVSTGAGHFVNVRLHGTASARDAIGAVVEVVTDSDRTWTRQLMAGDGYMATNERVLQFGLGAVENLSTLVVHWPSGTTTTLRDPAVDSTIQLVEGAPHAVVWQDGESRLVGID